MPNEPLMLGDFVEDPDEYTGEESPEESVDWLKLQSDAYRESTDFLDKGLRVRWEKNISLANSKHPKGSKYHTDLYKHRSKVFRGKTNAAIRKNMAAAAVALFSTQDVISVQAEDDNNPEQQEAAAACNELTNYHLESDIKWFLISMAAMRDAQVIGTVVSQQYWEYEEETLNDDMLAVRHKTIDRPVIDLLPIENVRISPHANWLDPVNSSPYVIILQPMFISDVKARMDDDWYPYSDAELKSALGADDMLLGIRKERDTDADPQNEDSAVSDHEVVFVRQVYMREGGQEWVYYALGENILLSDPQPLEMVYPHCKNGRRNIQVGWIDIEPHVVYKTGLPERVEGSQVQANEIANQRFDNVQLVLNKRYLGRRDSSTDWRSVVRNVPGSVTLTDDVDKSIRELTTNDVTASSFQEQHLINADFDELSGAFSSASVNTNRKLNETVGGMKLLNESANVLTEFQLRVFVETWVEPVMRELLEMVRTYEDDEVIQQVSGQQLTRGQLQTRVKMRVNVGFGSTDPQQKVQRLMTGLTTLAQLRPDVMQGADIAEISAEVFGALGFKDGKRFFPGLDGQDPRVAQLMQQIQQMQQYIEQEKAKQEAMLQKAQMDSQTRIQVEQMKQEGEQLRQIRELAFQEGVTLAEIKAVLEGKQVDIVKERVKAADDLKAKLYLNQPGFWEG